MSAKWFTLVAFSLVLARTAAAAPITSTLDILYDGSNVSTAGINVTSWNNQGLLGSAGHATPSTPNVPTLVTSALNGQNVIDFAGTVPTVLQSPTFSPFMAQANHVFLVLNSDVNTAGSGQVVFDGVTGTERHFFQITTAGAGHIYAGASHFSSSTLSAGAYRIFSLVFNGASSQIDVNAAPFYTPGDIGAQPLGRIGLGNSPPNGNPANLQFDGQYAEVAVFSSALNGAEQKIVENYLSSKYNVGGTVVAVVNNTLGTNDRYAGDLASNGNYDSDVFGIGRINVSNQLATSEFNAGLQLIGDASLENGEWVLAGHNTPTNSIDANGIWDRVWYVDKTLTTGTVDGVNATLTFDFSDGGVVAPQLTGTWTTTLLLYSPTDPYNFGTLVAGGTVLGDTVSFFVPNALLLDGYYTLQVSIVPEPSTGLLLGLGAIGMAIRTRRRRAQAAQRVSGT